jgi:glycosyltransferase involved in cell wall biosynthesis
VSEPLVSVVVPCFQHAEHVEEALRSVTSQRGVALELVVVDDASRDDTVAVVERVLAEPAFAARFEGRARLLVHERNLGAHAAINRGLRECHGDYVTILNDDDAFGPGRLATLVGALRDAGSALAMSRIESFGAGTGDEDRLRAGFRLRAHQDGAAAFPSLGFACMASNVAISSGNLLFTRALLDAVGDFDDLRYCHDWGFLLRAVLETEPVLVPEPLYRYRLHDSNAHRGLESVAVAETDFVLRRFFERIRGGRSGNPLVPSPQQWPGVFEYWMDRLGFWRYW